MNQSDRFALPLLEAGQAQKEITHNEALLSIDRLLHLAVVARSAAPPAATPAAGDAWIVSSGASAAWSGAAGQIAAWDGFGWVFIEPRPGMLAWVAAEGVFAIYRDDGWSNGDWPATGLRIGTRTLLSGTPVGIADAAGGTTVDSEARAVLSALLSALRAQQIVV